MGTWIPLSTAPKLELTPSPRIIVATTAEHYRDIITMLVVIGNNALAATNKPLAATASKKIQKKTRVSPLMVLRTKDQEEFNVR
jgi:hypothetical protein